MYIKLRSSQAAVSSGVKGANGKELMILTHSTVKHVVMKLLLSVLVCHSLSDKFAKSNVRKLKCFNKILLKYSDIL